MVKLSTSSRDDPLFLAEAISERYTIGKKSTIIESLLDFTNKEIMGKINDNDVTFCKLAIHSTEEQEYTMSFACVNPKEVILLESFPKVIVVDTTGKSNSEKRSLY